MLAFLVHLDERWPSNIIRKWLLGPDMAKSLSLSGLFEDSKYPRLILAVGAILLLLLQLGIFVAVYNQSGLKSRVCMLDSNGSEDI